MRKQLLASVLLAPLLLSSCATTGDKTKTASASCFLATVTQDQAKIRFDQPLSSQGEVSGILEYAFAQKDQSWGIFTGKNEKDKLSISYQFLSEGVVSYRDIIFTKSPNGNFAGEGFRFTPSESCRFTKSGYLWKSLATSNVKADTFHDPETGYYARLTFEFPTAEQDMKIRCIGAVSDSQGKVIARWINFGFLGTGNINNWNMGTNIRPDQVDSVPQGQVSCEYSI